MSTSNTGRGGFARIEFNAAQVSAAEQKLGDALERRMWAATAEVEGHVLRSLRHGQPPSRPGEPPHVRTATLIHSIARFIVRDRSSVTGYVGALVPYARHLELGTSKMHSRPFMRPALAAAWPKIQRIYGGG